MEYLLSLPKEIADRIHTAGKSADPDHCTALMISSVAYGRDCCTLQVSDLIEMDGQPASKGSFLLCSPALMNAIDAAMARAGNILVLRHKPGLPEDGFDPWEDMTNRILFRIAYHYLPGGLHACLVCNGDVLFGQVWLKNEKTEPMRIRVC